MGFDIFAAGTDNFHYQRKGCEDGGTFNAIQLISTLQGLDVSSLQSLGRSYAKSQNDPTNEPSGYIDAMIFQVKMEMLHNLSNAVCILSMKNTDEGWIYLNATEKHTFWADTMRAAKYGFSPGDLPGAEFIKTIINSLKDTSMDNFGVIQQLAIVLSKFSNHIDDDMTPKISITLMN